MATTTTSLTWHRVLGAGRAAGAYGDEVLTHAVEVRDGDIYVGTGTLVEIVTDPELI